MSASGRRQGEGSRKPDLGSNRFRNNFLARRLVRCGVRFPRTKFFLLARRHTISDGRGYRVDFQLHAIAEEAHVFAAAAPASAERGEPRLTRLRPTDLKSRLTALGFRGSLTSHATLR